MPPLATLWPWYSQDTTDAAVNHRDMSSTPSRPRDTLLQRFGATLRQYRQQRRLSQPALAASTGIRRAYISQIETGKRNIAVLTLLRLARALNIPAAWLLAGLDTYATLAPPVGCDPLPHRGTRDAGLTQDDMPYTRPNDQTRLLPLLGATIRQARQSQRLSQPALAARTGLSFGYISAIELGQRNLSVLSLVRIADALGLSMAHLLAPLEAPQSPSAPLTK
jgi:transcriptional regulator with XRE-family HTH domain